MRTLSVALTMALLLVLSSTACKSEPSDPCAGPKLKAPTLPVTYHIEKSEFYLGAVTFTTTGEPSFEAAKGAPADKLKAFQATFDLAIKGDSVSWKFDVRDESTSYRCGASMKKGAPEYPEAFKRHLYSEYYDIAKTAPATP